MSDMQKLKLGGASKGASEEQLSIYNRIGNNYESFRKEKCLAENTDLVREIAREIFGTSKAEGKRDQLSIYVRTMNAIVTEVLGLTLDEFNAEFSTTFNKAVHVENLGRKISELASPEIRAECLFDQKRIVFRMVWPEYYKEHFPKVDCATVFDARGTLKANLCRASKVSLEDGKKSYGAEVDSIIFDAIEETVEKSISDGDVPNWEFESYVMKILAQPKKNFPAMCNGSKKPGCLEVIDARGCYECPLDFYFLSLSPESQIEHFDEFMELRENTGAEHNKVIDAAYEAFCENRKDFWEML